MNDLLTMINHLLAAAIADRETRGAVQVRSVVLDGEGARVVLWLDHPQARGEAVLRVRVEPAQGGRQSLRLTLEQGPPEWGPGLEPFRRLLETARVSIDLDFSD